MTDSPTDRAATLERRCRQAVELHLQDFVDAAYELRRLGFPKDATLAWLKWAKVLIRKEGQDPGSETTVAHAIPIAQGWAADTKQVETFAEAIEATRGFGPFDDIDQHRPLLSFLIAELPHLAFRPGQQSWIPGQVGIWIQRCRDLLDPPKPEASRAPEPDESSGRCRFCEGAGCTDCEGRGYHSCPNCHGQGCKQGCISYPPQGARFP